MTRSGRSSTRLRSSACATLCRCSRGSSRCPAPRTSIAGCELWDLSLVDPDNRRPVDFARRAELLAAPAPPLDEWRSGALKLHVTAAGLRARRAHRSLFGDGDYLALDAAGCGLRVRPPAPRRPRGRNRAARAGSLSPCAISGRWATFGVTRRSRSRQRTTTPGRTYSTAHVSVRPTAASSWPTSSRECRSRCCSRRPSADLADDDEHARAVERHSELARGLECSIASRAARRNPGACFRPCPTPNSPR